MSTASQVPHADPLVTALVARFPVERCLTDPLRLLAWGTDASFYRLIPRVVVVIEDPWEVSDLLAMVAAYGSSVTFRGSGTSLSGQAVTDQVLAVLGDGWRSTEVLEDGGAIRLGPGVLGGEANRVLAPLDRKIGPDPASIHAASVGGIAANNASGMCCGVARNSYHTLRALRLVLADGSQLDTACAESRAAFAQSHPDLLSGLTALRARVLGDEVLVARIRHKFAIKNTTGYALDALLDFEDPIEILAHLMVGSEGTLGFLESVTLETVPEPRYQATALACYADAETAARAVVAVSQAPVAAVELIDDRGLASFAGHPGLPEVLTRLPSGATALLIEVQAPTEAELSTAQAEVSACLDTVPALEPFAFTTDAVSRARLWQVRKGLFPLVGANRPKGTTVVIEDVAFPIEHLAAGTVALQELMERHGYHDGIVFGHALAGNLHFVFAQSFADDTEVERYAAFMDDLVELVVDRFDGSLKAEHGTGRNMAPFVMREWGEDAYQLMVQIKALLDPQGVLNRGVVLTEDPRLHLKDLKPIPAADPGIDRCTECGFCEPVCPSRGLTLTPRQRIVSWRRLAGDAAAPEATPEEVATFAYQGLDTCATCGLCATLCPLGIDTGDLVRRRRQAGRSPLARSLAGFAADHQGALLTASRLGLKAAGFARGVLGPERLERFTSALHRQLPAIPRWRASGPTAHSWSPSLVAAGEALAGSVVYLPSCLSRSMGPAPEDEDLEPLPQVVTRLFERAGYRVLVPPGIDSLCCGLPFSSKGFPEAGAAQWARLQAALWEASEGGRWPIVTDTSPCAWRARIMVQDAGEGPVLLDLTDFLHDHVLARLVLHPLPEAVAVHVTCSGQKFGNGGKLRALAEACVERVVVPEDVTCCGFAGDKGFFVPELADHALRTLRSRVEGAADSGCSTSRTCEIGLSDLAGVPYRSIAYLLERASRP